MKTKYTMLAAALAMTVPAVAQEVDDMYFNARDRVVLSESNQAAMAMQYAALDQQAVKTNPVNPSDSYTGRGVNPEFSAQQKNGAEIIQDNPDYFLSTYAPKNVNANLFSGNPTTSNCACNTGSAYSGMAYSGFGNPYPPYGMYSPYGYGSPYAAMGYGFGTYGSVMSMSGGYGTGSMYSNPYYGMYGPYGYAGYPGAGYGYPAVIADPIQNVPGRRPVPGVKSGSQGFLTSGVSGTVVGTNGRTRATQNYYDPSWRSDASNFPTRSFDTGGRSSGYNAAASTGRTWGSDTGRTWGSEGVRTRSYDSFGAGESGGSRSSFGSSSSPAGGSSPSGGSSSGGRSRGRN